MSKKEFRVENEYDYNRSGPLRWILSHVLRYPWLPVLVTAASIINNFAASFVQVFIGRAFDLISTPGWVTTALLGVALSVFGAVAAQSALGIARNYANEYIAQRIERLEFIRALEPHLGRRREDALEVVEEVVLSPVEREQSIEQAREMAK